jgi:hypothetical protein
MNKSFFEVLLRFRHESRSWYRFSRHRFSYLATCFAFLCGLLWFLGDTLCFLANARTTGAEAVANLQQVLGSPEDLILDMKNTTQDFIQDHFGSLAMAAAFGIAIRMRS